MKKRLVMLLVAVCFSAMLFNGCSKDSEKKEETKTETTEESKDEAKAEDSKTEEKTKAMGSAKDGNEVSVETVSMKLVKAVEEGGYTMVNTEELKSWVDNKEDMILIDTMPADHYKSKRIPTAVNAELPVAYADVTPEQREAFVSLLGTDKDKKIVIYCGFVGCERSHVGALIAKEEGFTNVVRHPGGIIAWIDAGYDIESDD